MKLAALVSKSWLARAQLPEIVARFGRRRPVHAEFDTSRRCAVNGNVKVHPVGDFRLLFAKESLKQTANHVSLGAAPWLGHRGG